MELTIDQKKAYDDIIDFVASGKKLMTLGGFAGTGKTTLIGEASKQLKEDGKRIAFCTFSGKASTILRSKLEGILVKDEDYCGTIHSLIYVLVGKDVEKRKLYFDIGDKDVDYDLIVIDEASMINEWIFKDLSSYGIPILAVGDHGQLPPVEGRFNLMESPEIKLETIMRQAEDNPIIKVSMIAREEGRIPDGDFGGSVIKIKNIKNILEHGYDFKSRDSIILCAMNRTRNSVNYLARTHLDIKPMGPTPGEPLICLYNNRRLRIYNGNIGTLEKVEYGRDKHLVEIDMGDFKFAGDILAQQFGQRYTMEKPANMVSVELFDWAYCITVHKSQGSEFQTVALIAERMNQMNEETWRKWLYTGVTRAKKTLFVVE